MRSSLHHVPFIGLALLTACGSSPVLTDRDAGGDASPPVDGGRGDAGPPQVDGGPACATRDPFVPEDPTAGHWAATFANPGVGGDLPNVEAFAFGAAGQVYVGGEFTTAGYQPAANIAWWDGGTGWHPMGAGVDGHVRSIALDAESNVYAAHAVDGGWDTTRISRWDGTSWTVLADAENGSIHELALVGTTLVAAGSFTRIAGVDLAGLARLDGTTWSGWAGLAPDGAVRAISATSMDDLCIGGEFGTLGVVTSRGAACWDGTAWQPRPLVLEFYRGVFDLVREPESGALIGVGDFMLDETGANGGSVARWTTDHWELIGGGIMSELGPGGTQEVRGVAFAPGGMFVGGGFGSIRPADPIRVHGAARWDGTAWQELGGLFKEVGFSIDSTNVAAVAAGPDGSVYFGGLFTRADSVRVAHVVRWDGTYWSALRTPGEHYEGVSGQVHAFARDGACAIYVGGEFEYAGDIRANSIARYTPGEGFTAMDDGVLGAVFDVASARGGRAYISGGFLDTATGTEFANLATWDGVSWEGVGGSVTGNAWAVALDEGTGFEEPERVYVAGSIDTAGGGSVRRVAMWDGTAWSDLGGGVEGYPLDFDPTMTSEATVYDLFVDPTTRDVIVAGNFRLAGTGAGQVESHNVARWDGEAWHAMGDGLGGLFETVFQVALWDGRLVASGTFEASGARDVAFIAQWDGTAWQQLGAPLEGATITDLVPVGDVLFAGGILSLGGTGPAPQVAAWDGTAWRDLGGGVSDVVNAMIAMDEGVYLAGGFDRAGSAPSVGLALWQFEK